jgi:hypothetical protein
MSTIENLEIYFRNYKDIISQYFCEEDEVLFISKKDIKSRKVGSDDPFKTVFIGGTMEETKAFIDGALRVHWYVNRLLENAMQESKK